MTILTASESGCCGPGENGRYAIPSALLSDVQWDQLREAGVIHVPVDEDCVRSARIVGLIAGSKEAIWEALNDPEANLKIFKELVSNETYLERENELGIRETVSTFGIKTTYHAIRTLDREAGVMSWRLDKSKENDIADTSGAWVIEPHEGKCLVLYCTYVDAGGDLKNWVLERGGRGKAREAMENLKDWVEARPDSRNP